MTNHKDSTSPCVLIVEPDPDIGETLRLLLEDEGYTTHIVTALHKAFRLVDERIFDAILTDLMPPDAAPAAQYAEVNPLRGVTQLREQAALTPIIITTGWPIAPEQASLAGFSALLPRPFAIGDLLATLASVIRQPFSPEQERQVATIQLYCAAFNRHDLDACLDLCAADVVFSPPADTPFAEQSEIRGRAAYRQHLENGLHLVPDFQFGACTFYARPHGLAMRFEESWRSAHAPSGRASMIATMLFEFEGDDIVQIGARLNDQRLKTLLAAPIADAPLTTSE